MLQSIRSKKNIKKLLLVCMLALIAVLLIVFFYLSYVRGQEMDISLPYTPENSSETACGTAEPFSQNLVVSPASVGLDGVTLSDEEEKALLFNLETGEAVFAQNIYDQTWPASITKIMTAIVAMKYGNMQDTVTMIDADFALEEGSQLSGMQAGDTVTMDQLFHTLLVYSANDAAMAIARQVGGSVENFVAMMNEEAKALGMTGTHFANPHGLHSEEHYTCAYDVYLMLNEAVSYSQFREVIRMSSYTLSATHADGSSGAYSYSSTDKYLTGEKSIPEGVSLWGGKTGTTPQAGSCLALAAQNRNGIPYIVIVMNANNSTELYTDMTALLSHV